MTPEIKVLLEVSDEVVMNGKKQVAYVHLGKQYPEKMEVWVPDDGAYKPGNYLATDCYLSNEKYPRLLIGLNKLVPAQTRKPA